MDVCGKSGSGKGSLLKAIGRYLEPIKNIDGSLGSLRVADVDIHNVGRKYITEQIVALMPVPFVFTATLRENLDPLNVHTDFRIK